jgi:hypothetical protein
MRATEGCRSAIWVSVLANTLSSGRTGAVFDFGQDGLVFGADAARLFGGHLGEAELVARRELGEAGDIYADEAADLGVGAAGAAVAAQADDLPAPGDLDPADRVAFLHDVGRSGAGVPAARYRPDRWAGAVDPVADTVAAG